MTLTVNTNLGLPNGAAPQVSVQGSGLLQPVALPFLCPQRPPVGPLLAEGKGQKRIVCGRVSRARCSAHTPLAKTQTGVLSNWREAGQWRPAHDLGGSPAPGGLVCHGLLAPCGTCEFLKFLLTLSSDCSVKERYRMLSTPI